MTKSIFRRLLIAAFIGYCLTEVSDRCFADEFGIPVCPDLHQHETVLRDGERYFDRNKDLNRSGKRRGLNSVELGTFANTRIFYDTAHDEKQFATEIANLKFDSEDALSKANKVANECLILGRAPEAHEIEKRVLSAYDSGSIHTKPDDLAAAIQTMIRCQLINGCENTDQVERYSSIRRLYHKYSSFESKHRNYEPSFDEIVLANLTSRIETMRPANTAWEEALSLNKRLNQLHFNKPTDSSFLCLLATLLEWNNQISEAHTVLLSVEEINPSKFVQTATISFCRRNDDFIVLKHLESKMVQSPRDQLVPVLRLYLAKKHCEEASQIFRKMISDYKTLSESGQGAVLYAVHDSIKCLDDSDEPMLQTFLATVLDQNYYFDYEWIDITLTEGKKKWKNFPAETFREYTRQDHKQTPAPLRRFALFFASNDDHALALEAQGAVLSSIDRTTKIWNNLDERFAALVQAKADLSAPWVIQSPQGKTLRKKVELALSEISAEHEKRECLAVAAKLDETASKLESHDLFAKAEEMHRESLNIKLKNLGPNNAEILNSLNGLARTLSMQKKYKEADTVYQKALALYHGNKQLQDRSFGTVLESYAQMLVSAGQKTRADKIYEDARTFYRNNK